MGNCYSYILSFFLISVLGYGQVSLLSETNTKNYEVKEPFKLNIGLEITGHLEQQTPLKLPDLSKFEILGNASEVFSFVDPETGIVVKQIVYQLILEPKQAGKLKIGSALVQVNGKIYKSEAFDIFVKENHRKTYNTLSAKDVHLSMEVENTDRYAFQPIKIILKAQSKNFQNLRKINQIQLPKYAHIHPINLKKQDIEIQEYGEESASQTIASFILFPKNSGNIIIPPAFAQLDKKKILSNNIKINIKPLPKNAPKNFVNAVGNFKINIQTSEKIIVNQPLDLFLKLSGEGNLNQISLPKILESNDYKIFHPKKTIKTTPTSNGLQGEIVEHYILIPKKEGKINILIQEFVFFNPQKNIYETIHKNYNIKSLHIAEQNLNTEEIPNNTGHILKKVDLSPIPSQKNINWSFIFTTIIFLGIITGFIFWIFRKKKKNIITSIPQENKITTIAETEEILRNTIFIGKDYYFRLMEKSLKEEKYSLFFEYYDELHNDAEQQVELYEKTSISQFLENTINPAFAKDFEKFREKILLQKYTPAPHNLYEFYTNIVKFYSKIMK